MPIQNVINQRTVNLTIQGTITTSTGGISLAPIVGESRIFPALPVPAGWLLEDGSAVSRTTYSGLFAVIGAAFGAGNGSTTFNLPDSRGRVAMAAGTGTGLTARTVGGYLGAETHTLSWNEMPTHNHYFSDTGHAHSTGGLFGYPPTITAELSGLDIGGYFTPQGIGRGPVTSSTGYAYGNTYNSGSYYAHNNIQPSIVRGYPAVYAGGM